MNRVFDTALERGWVVRAQIPKVKNTGSKGTAREAFSQSEYNSLASYMVNWSEQGHTEKTRHMRALLRDYVLVLKNTGVRHGTEALALLNQGSLQQAREILEKVVKISPKHFDAFHLLGIIAAQLKDFESADELFG